MPERAERRKKVLLWAVWLCFVLRGTFYCTAFPLWEGFDEYGHVALIQHVYFHHDLPDPRRADSPRDIAESRQLVAAPWVFRNDAQGLLTQEEYWRLSGQDRFQRQARLRSLPLAWSAEDAEPKLPLYEAQQPPLYYWLIMPVYWSVKSLDLPSRVWVLRLVTMLLASVAIPIAFVIARRFFRDHRAALGVAVVVASMPHLRSMLPGPGTKVFPSRLAAWQCWRWSACGIRRPALREARWPD